MPLNFHILHWRSLGGRVSFSLWRYNQRQNIREAWKFQSSFQAIKDELHHFLSKDWSSPKRTDERSQLSRVLVHPLIQITYNNMHSKISYFSFSVSKQYELMQSRSAITPIHCLPINSRSAPEVHRAALPSHGITKQWSS